MPKQIEYTRNKILISLEINTHNSYSEVEFHCIKKRKKNEHSNSCICSCVLSLCMELLLFIESTFWRTSTRSWSSLFRIEFNCRSNQQKEKSFVLIQTLVFWIYGIIAIFILIQVIMSSNYFQNEHFSLRCWRISMLLIKFSTDYFLIVIFRKKSGMNPFSLDIRMYFSHCYIVENTSTSAPIQLSLYTYRSI